MGVTVGQHIEVTLYGFPEIVRVVAVDEEGGRIKVRAADGTEEWIGPNGEGVAA